MLKCFKEPPQCLPDVSKHQCAQDDLFNRLLNILLPQVLTWWTWGGAKNLHIDYASRWNSLMLQLSDILRESSCCSRKMCDSHTSERPMNNNSQIWSSRSGIGARVILLLWWFTDTYRGEEDISIEIQKYRIHRRHKYRKFWYLNT